MSGSMAAGGASLRAYLGHGHEGTRLLAGSARRGRRSGAFIAGCLRARWAASRRSAPGPRPSKATPGRRRCPGQPTISRQPVDHGGVAGHEEATPAPVRTWSTCRRSPSTRRRSTRPRATSPSTMAVTLGGRTASRSARSEETAVYSSSRPSTRYWGRERSAVARPISTCLASQAAVRPSDRLWSVAGSVRRRCFERHLVRLSNRLSPRGRIQLALPANCQENLTGVSKT